MKGLDLRKFSKLKSDAKTTTLKHPDGHMITLAHKALSPANQKELHSLPFADGGEIPGGNGSPSIDPSKIGGDVTESGDPIVKAVSDTYQKMFGKAKGGKIDDPTQSNLLPGDSVPNKIEKQVVSKTRSRYSGDDDVPEAPASNAAAMQAGATGEPLPPKKTKDYESSSSYPLSARTASPDPDAKYKKSVKDFNDKMAGYAQGGAIQKQQGVEKEITKEREPAKKAIDWCRCDNTVGDNPKCKQHRVQKYAEGTDDVQEAQQEAAPAVPEQPQTTDAEGNGIDSSLNANGMPKQQDAGIDPSLKANGLPTQPSAPSVAPALQQHLTDERAKFAEDLVNGHITPKTYADLFASKNTLGKVGTIFGLLLGGMGSGITKQPNAALAAMDQIISNDLKAQTQSKANAQNFLRIYQQGALNQANIANVGSQTQGRNIQNENDQLLLNKTKEALGDAVPTANARMGMDLATLHYLEGISKSLPPGPQKQAADQLLQGMSQQIDQSHNNIIQSTAAAANQIAHHTEQEAIQASADKGGEDSHTYSVLAPDALKKSIGLSKIPMVDNPKLQNQLTAATQVEKVLNGPKGDGQGGIHELLHDMYDDIGRGGWTGGLEQRVKSNVEKIPFVGHGAEGVMNVIGQGEGYKEYTQKAAALKNDLATALHGIVSVGDLDKMIDPMLPTVGDKQQDIARKEQQIVQTILKAIPTDELDKWKLTKRK